MSSLRETVKDLALDAAEMNQVRLYDLYAHRDRFQVFIDRGSPGNSEAGSAAAPPPIRIEDCERVSRSLSFLLQTRIPDFFKKWSLEISSPGIERRLREKRHFEEAAEREMKITAFSPGRARCGKGKAGAEFQTRFFSGRLISFKNDIAVLKKNETVWETPFSEIKQAFLLPPSPESGKKAEQHKQKQAGRKRKADILSK